MVEIMNASMRRRTINAKNKGRGRTYRRRKERETRTAIFISKHESNTRGCDLEMMRKWFKEDEEQGKPCQVQGYGAESEEAELHSRKRRCHSAEELSSRLVMKKNAKKQLQEWK